MILVEEIERLPILGNLLFAEFYGRLPTRWKWLVQVCVASALVALAGSRYRGRTRGLTIFWIGFGDRVSRVNPQNECLSF